MSKLELFKYKKIEKSTFLFLTILVIKNTIKQYPKLICFIFILLKLIYTDWSRLFQFISALLQNFFLIIYSIVIFST